MTRTRSTPAPAAPRTRPERAEVPPGHRVPWPVAVAAGAWAGCGAGVVLDADGALRVMAAVLPAALLAAAVAVRTTGWARAVAAALALASLASGTGAVLASSRAAGRAPSGLDAVVAAGADVRAVLRVTSDPQELRARPGAGAQGPRVLVEARAVETTHRGRTWSSPVPLLVLGGAGWRAVRLDGLYEVRGRLEPSRDRGDRHVAVLRPGPPAEVAPPRAAWRVAEHVRARLRQSVAPLPGPAPGLLPSLAVGDTTTLPDGVRDDMRAAGLAHLTVVSGANVTLLCGSAVALLALAGAGPRWQAAGGAAALVVLVLLARPDPSVLRAVAMGAVGLAGLLLGRPARVLGALGLAVAVLLALDPWLARAPGFALSVLATAGIACLAGPLAARTPRLPAVVAQPLAVTVAAQVTVTPVLVGLEPSVAAYAVPANLLAAPAVAPVVTLTTLAAAVAAVSPAAGTWVAALAAPGAAWIGGVAHVVAGLPGATLPWWSGPAGVALAAVAGAGVAALALVPAPLLRRVAALPAGTVRARGAAHRGGAAVRAAPVVVVAVVALVTVLPPGAVRAWSPPAWQVLVCDVGQGEAVLLRAGPASAVVVDTGPDPGAMRRCLADAGVESVPLLVLSHFHADHVGGLPGLLGTAAVTAAWHSPALAPAAGAGEALSLLAAAGVPARAAASGDRVQAGSAALLVLAPDRVPDPVGAAAGDATAVNDASVVLRADLPGLAVLCLGDVEFASQRRLVATAPPGLLDVDVTTVAHHGSAVQVPALYAAASPLLAVASAGAGNDYGHPDAGTTAMVARTGATVVTTAAAGHVAAHVEAGAGAGVEAGTPASSPGAAPVLRVRSGG